jgi:flagellar biosynthesis/type III secretory pathway protein FliH
MKDTDTGNAAAKQKGEEEGEENGSEEEGESVHVRHSMTLQRVDTLLDYMGKRAFE